MQGIGEEGACSLTKVWAEVISGVAVAEVASEVAVAEAAVALEVAEVGGVKQTMVTPSDAFSSDKISIVLNQVSKSILMHMTMPHMKRKSLATLCWASLLLYNIANRKTISLSIRKTIGREMPSCATVFMLRSVDKGMLNTVYLARGC